MRTIRMLDMTTQIITNMALDVPFKEQFKCCICLDIYTKPATIPCGHTFCLDCIDGFWDTKTKAECPLCKETFRKRPQLRINKGYIQIIDFYIRSQEENVDGVGSRKTSLIPLFEPEEIPCDICRGDKSQSVKSCLVCQASYCEPHLTPHLSDPALHRHQLTDPATLATSHLCRKHHEPLTMFCKKDQKPVCVQCTERKHKHHKTVPIEEKNKMVKIRLRETISSIQPMIHTRLRKVNVIKNSLALSKQITEREIESSAQICSMLISTIERQHSGLVEELEKRQQEAEMRAEELFQELEEELNDLQMRCSELQHLEHTRNPVHFIQSFPSLRQLPYTREWSEVAVHSDNCMGVVTRTVSKLGDICQELANKLSAEDLFAEADKLDQYALNVTLDPETASGWLVLSPDRKKVSISSKKNNSPLPDSPQRFDSCVCVLGKQSFASGRRYWVVEVGDKTDWDLGVARESINRKGVITVRPDNGYWAICRRKGSSLSACAGPSVTLHLKETPKKVGVFLDYEEGLVSFHDAEAKTHIYTYSGCDFTELLYPYFNPCVQEDGKNTAPLIICPVDGGVRERRDITIESAA
ncbi:E3 ubiquitin-protein ligase TRIM39-like isoform X2 [Sander lucioperca]|uniref:E3 ubiquitin-protein ligase TRIM39-like isoform X2 n=1 Tax=Sander lucioperca TaxID=283035 RepID=UPI00125DB0E9|nr:E3 ubiquitin-protein ligase TRIM39-like isoform X2 [Sander lucioperca]